ncbi:MAG: PEGA domain-containing protein [Sandaracinaceae bacterium]
MVSTNVRRFGAIAFALVPALLLAQLLAPPGALAQDRNRARQLYNEAQALFDSGQYAQAEASFRAAFDAVPNPVVLKAIAAAQERQGNVSGAIETYERYLREATNATDRAEIEGRLRELRARPSTVMIASTPPGATISIDGRDTGRVTPADVEIPPGDHAIELRLTGYAPSTQQFSVPAGTRMRLELTLNASQSSDPMGSEGGDGQGAGDEQGGDSGGSSDDPSVGVWVTAGIAAAALVNGTVFGFLALSEQSNFDAQPSHEIADRGETFALVADISFGVAAAFAITAIVLYIVERSSGSSDSASAPDPNAVQLTAAPWASPNAAALGGATCVDARCLDVGGSLELRF